MNRRTELKIAQVKKTAETKQFILRLVKTLTDSVRNIKDSLQAKIDDLTGRVSSLEKLDLKDGRDGIDGKDGKDGLNGKDGRDGKDGADGKDGKQGIKGRDGLDGKDGKDGYTPIKKVDYFTDSEIAEIVIDATKQSIKVLEKLVPDKEKLIKEVVKQVKQEVKTKTGTTITEEKVKELILKYRRGSKVINQAVWGEVTGTITRQTDLIELIPTRVSDLENDSQFVSEDEIPTKVSELENDAGYLTEETQEIPTKVSELENDSGYLTSETDPVWNNEKSGYPTLIGNNSLTGTNKFGSATDYLELGNAGTLKAYGTASWFDDLRVEPTVRGSGIKVPAYSVYKGAIYVYIFDNAIANAEKEVNFKLQLPHGWKTDSLMHLHIHWIPITTGNPNDKVRWGLEYTKASIGGVFGNPLTIYADTPVNPPSTTPTADTHYLTEFADIDLTGMGLSGIILGRIFRNSSHTDDTFAGSVGLLYIDAHIEFDQLGSNAEFIK